MLKHLPAGYARATLFAIALSMNTAALASIDLPGGDTFLDGSFQGMSYGVSGAANLAPRLFIGDLGNTLPPFDQILGTGLDFSYSPQAFGSSVVTVTYRLTNNDPGGTFNNLRFFLDLKTQGQSLNQDTATAVGFGSPTVAGAPDEFQIFDFNAPGDKPLQQIETNNNLNGDTAPTCSSGCFSDLALQWNKASLLVGETWEITATLVDNPGMIGGGRYLAAASLGADNTQIFFGSPTIVPMPPALLLMGSGLLWLLAFRRRKP